MSLRKHALIINQDTRKLIAFFEQYQGKGDIESAKLILAQITKLVNTIQNSKDDVVRRLREEGYTWQAIATVLGISKQTAWEKYGRKGIK